MIDTAITVAAEAMADESKAMADEPEATADAVKIAAVAAVRQLVSKEQALAFAITKER
jgi:hypothetical protein